MTCLWVTPEDMDGYRTEPYSQLAAEFASYVLWAMSGRRYNCPTTVTEHYECACTAYIAPSALNTGPILLHGGVVNASGRGCGCGVLHTRIHLRGRPVTQVHRVISSGVELDPGSYRIVNGNQLEAALGVIWNPCNVEVTYTHGLNLPAAGRMAAKSLAIELVKSYMGDESCQLPSRTTAVTRQGVSFNMLEDQSFLNSMKTSIYEVDLFLKVANPANATKPSRVFSPDVPRGYKVTARPVGEQARGPFDLSIVPGEPFTFSVSLAAAGAVLIDGVDWNPLVQINSWNGVSVYEYDPQHFSLIDGQLTFSLSAAETAMTSLSLDASWDLYAQAATSTSTIVHLLHANAYSAGATTPVVVLPA